MVATYQSRHQGNGDVLSTCQEGKLESPVAFLYAGYVYHSHRKESMLILLALYGWSISHCSRSESK